MIRVTGVVKHLLIVNVLIFLISAPNEGAILRHLILYYPASASFSPYQLITHMFTHAGISHLAFNMLTLFFLGPMVENYLGYKKFLIFYMISGFGAMIAHLTMAYLGFIPPHPVVGASGAIYGVLVGFAIFFPNTKLMLLIPPIPVKAKYLVLIIIAFDLFFGVSGVNTGIAHFAHLGGGLFGFLLIMYWRSQNMRR